MTDDPMMNDEGPDQGMQAREGQQAGIWQDDNGNTFDLATGERLLSVADLAKLLGTDVAMVNGVLEAQGILRKVNGKWLLTPEFEARPDLFRMVRDGSGA